MVIVTIQKKINMQYQLMIKVITPNQYQEEIKMNLFQIHIVSLNYLKVNPMLFSLQLIQRCLSRRTQQQEITQAM